LGKLQDSNNPLGGPMKKGAVDSSTTSAAKPKVKPKEVLEFEKKNAGRKKIKVRDGSTN
jgi:hypothetical protein